MKFLNNKVMPVLAGAAVLVAVGGVAGASAGSLITSAQIKDQTIQSRDIATDGVGSSELRDGSILPRDLSQAVAAALAGKDGATGPAGARGADGSNGKDGKDGTNGTNGTNGTDGAKGESGLANAYYSVANYDAGDTNQGAIATVACKATSDTAISGGVQTLGLGGKAAAVASSFPGRMDWSINEPKPNRFDGWIVQFDAMNAPEKTKVWALCVPNAGIAAVETYKQTD